MKVFGPGYTTEKYDISCLLVGDCRDETIEHLRELEASGAHVENLLVYSDDSSHCDINNCDIYAVYAKHGFSFEEFIFNAEIMKKRFPISWSERCLVSFGPDFPRAEEISRIINETTLKKLTMLYCSPEVHASRIMMAYTWASDV